MKRDTNKTSFFPFKASNSKYKHLQINTSGLAYTQRQTLARFMCGVRIRVDWWCCYYLYAGGDVYIDTCDKLVLYIREEEKNCVDELVLSIYSISLQFHRFGSLQSSTESRNQIYEVFFTIYISLTLPPSSLSLSL